MNLDQLQAIMVIVDKGSFRAAAQHLNRSQSALSAMVKNFESEFDILLFDRTQYRPALTPEGAAFLDAARNTVETAQYASRVATELGKKRIETALHVSVDPLVSPAFIKILTAECRKPLRPVTLVMEYSISQDDHCDLWDRRIDLALADCSTGLDKVEKIFLESVTLVGAISRSLLSEKQPVTRSFLEKTTQVLTCHKKYAEPPNKLISKPVYSGGPKLFVPDHFTKVRLIESGIGWGHVSEDEFNSNPDLFKIDESIVPCLTLDICLLRPKNRPLGPVGQAIWRQFEASCSRKSSVQGISALECSPPNRRMVAILGSR